MVALIGLDPVSTSYCTLAFKIERLFPGFVDAYYGPPGVKAMAELGDAPEAAALLERAHELAAAVAGSTHDLAPSRKRFLAAQIQGMVTTCRVLAGEALPYREEVRGCLDVDATRVPDPELDAALAELDALLPGDGDLGERMNARRDRSTIDVPTARRMIDLLMAETRRRTADLVDLPAGDEVTVEFVTDKPWSGYNWYLGGARSRVEVNTDLPIHATRLPDLIAHEAYPGHHTEHALKDLGLFRGKGLGEHGIHLINTPECVVSEGIATLAAGMIFPGDDGVRWQAEVLLPEAGIDMDAELQARIDRASRPLKAVAGNAALLLHEEGRPEREVLDYLVHYEMATEEKARKRLSFLTNPLWRPYIFTYSVGYDLLGAWVDAGGPEERHARFRRLLTEQVTPSQLAADLAS